MEMATYTYKAEKAISFLKEISGLNIKEFEFFKKLPESQKEEMIAISLTRTLARKCERHFKGLSFKFDGRNIDVARKIDIQISGKKEVLGWSLDPNSRNQEMLVKALNILTKKNVIGIKKVKKGFKMVCKNQSFSYNVAKDFLEEFEYDQVLAVKRIDQKWVVILADGTSKALPFGLVKKITADNIVKAEIDREGKIIAYRANGSFEYITPKMIGNATEYKVVTTNLTGTATYEYTVENQIVDAVIKVPILSISNPTLNGGKISWKLEKNEELSDENLEDYVTEKQKEGFLSYSVKIIIPEMEEFVLDELRERDLGMWINMMPKHMPNPEKLLADFSDTLRDNELLSIQTSHIICLFRVYKSANEHYPLFEKLSKDKKVELLRKAYIDAIKYGKGDIYGFSKFTFLVFSKAGLHRQVKLYGERKEIINYDWIKDHFDNYRNDPVKLTYAEYSYIGKSGLFIRRGLTAWDLWQVLFERGNYAAEDAEDDADIVE